MEASAHALVLSVLGDVAVDVVETSAYVLVLAVLASVAAYLNASSSVDPLVENSVAAYLETSVAAYMETSSLETSSLETSAAVFVSVRYCGRQPLSCRVGRQPATYQGTAASTLKAH